MRSRRSVFGAEAAAEENVGGRTVELSEFEFVVRGRGYLKGISDLQKIVLKNDGGTPVLVQDVARVELGAQNYNQACTFDGRPSVGLAVFQLPGTNALDVADQVIKAMDRLKTTFPEGMEYSTPYDTTIFVRESIREVYQTLFEAGVLVLIVILVFLQDWRATLVPATTVPVTIIGAFAAMWALGFTVNLLTLFGLILAIGIWVTIYVHSQSDDDAGAPRASAPADTLAPEAAPPAPAPPPTKTPEPAPVAAQPTEAPEPAAPAEPQPAPPAASPARGCQ